MTDHIYYPTSSYFPNSNGGLFTTMYRLNLADVAKLKKLANILLCMPLKQL